MNVTNAASVIPFADAQNFLLLGPIGLAGLLLVLTAVVLLTKLDRPKERLLRTFLLVGAACFAMLAILDAIPKFSAPKRSPEDLATLNAVVQNYDSLKPKLEMARDYADPPDCQTTQNCGVIRDQVVQTLTSLAEMSEQVKDRVASGT